MIYPLNRSWLTVIYPGTGYHDQVCYNSVSNLADRFKVVKGKAILNKKAKVSKVGRKKASCNKAASKTNYMVYAKEKKELH